MRKCSTCADNGGNLEVTLAHQQARAGSYACRFRHYNHSGDFFLGGDVSPTLAVRSLPCYDCPAWMKVLR